MANNKQLDRLKSLLKDLFQLDQPELDFGLYKIMHAKSVQITRFLETDLLKEIETAFGARDSANAEQLFAQAKAKLFDSLGDAALDANGELNPTFAALPAGKKYLEDMAAAQAAKGSLSADAEIYDHLYRFFERYYDNGDFLSRRYYARESDTRAAPYSVPYDGREVYLHWANKDQYYIKSGENFTHYTFDLIEAVKKLMEGAKANGQDGGFDFEVPATATGEQKAMKVHLRIAEAQEGEHGNIKSSGDQKREFIPLLSKPADLDADGSLVLNFEYKLLPEGYPFDEAAIKTKFGNINKEHMPAHWMADVFLHAMAQLPEGQAADYMRLLSLLAPTDKQSKRPLLAKYISLYTARNTMDYFIHKDLGGFLRRELDFYIKNEVMRLDDIENADAPKVEQYLGKVKVLRRIAHQLIAFLAQLEDFQKKLWLKKKFVTEVNYCITLDRIPESFYPEIAANSKQREEWIKILAIDADSDYLSEFKYSAPLTEDFLKINKYLVLDTVFFSEEFNNKLLQTIQNIDANINGLLINSDNFQALNFIREKSQTLISGVYIDPPYNTDATEIIYKNGYKDSSWMSLMENRLALSKQLMSKSAVSCVTIDECEVDNLSLLLKQTMTGYDLRPVIIEYNHRGRVKSNFSITHEYALWSIPTGIDSITRQKEISADIRRNLRRTGTDSLRIDSPAQFYGIEVDKNTLKIISVTDALAVNESIPVNTNPDTEIIWPIDDEGKERRWYYGKDRILNDSENGLIWAKLISGKIQIHYHQDGQAKRRKSVLIGSEFDASTHGSELLNSMFKEKIFDFPKSVYAVQECIESMPLNNGSTVLDYFAGSGTTAHAIINMARNKSIDAKYILVEMGAHFDNVIKPRIQKVVYSSIWSGCLPSVKDGISHAFKYIRLESYEDALNNLIVADDAARDRALEASPELRSAYMLNYWLDVETQGSPSLLNVKAFADPTNYVMKIKRPGSDALALQRIDLIETFNWLIGLWVEHLAAPQTFSAEFEREVEKDLPKDQNTRLVCKRLKQDDQGPYWFRLVEGYTLKVPGDDSSRQKTLVVWRKLTDNPEQDNAALQKFLMEKLQISPRENTYAVIYVNGSHTLPNPLVESEQTKVRLIEEAFHAAMWSQEAN
jgi:adenine-specific DNA-methyltransferase